QGNRVNREYAVAVPGFVQHSRNPRVAEIEDGRESRVVVAQRQKAQSDRDRDEAVNHTPSDRAVFFVAHWRVLVNQVDENWRQQNDLGAIAERQGEAYSGERRAVIDQNEIERAELTHDGESQRDMPRAGESQIRPHPGP